jgi:DNA invertase Pin-like site-specific DNA recombinase
MTTHTGGRPIGQKLIDIYCRISQDYDGTLRSVESQEEDCRDAIDEQSDWTAGKAFHDHALSAWNPKVERPQFNQLMTRLESGDSDGVMVYDLTRFTRKPIEGERLLALAKRGVVVASITSEYNLLTADGRKQFRDAMNAAAHESDKISERVARGKRKKARRGKSNASYRGYAMPGYLPNPEGWEPGEPRTPVPADQLAAEREVVREMARRVLAGDTLDGIVRDLNTRGVTTVMGMLWTSVTVRQLLRRPSLTGLVEYKGEIQKGKDGQPMTLDGDPVLDRDTWDALQSHFSARKRGRPATTYLLSGLARCGQCGHVLYGRPRVGLAPYDDGEPRRQYWCQPRAHGGGCGKLAIDQRYADAEVGAAVLRRLGDPKHARVVAKQAAAAKAARAVLLADIARLDNDAQDLASKTGTWGLARVEAAMESIDAQLGKARAKLAAIDGPDAQPMPASDVTERWAKAVAEGNISALRQMVREAFPKLTIRAASSRGRASLTPDRFDWDGSTAHSS